MKNTLKRLFALVISLALILSVTPITASALSDEAYCSAYHIADDVTKTVVGGADIPFSNNGESKNFTHTPSKTTFTVSTTGIYMVEYRISYTSGNGAAIAVAVNGSPEDSTNKSFLVNYGEVSGKAMLSLNAGDVLTLRNNSSTPFTMITPGLDSTVVGAWMNIVKINEEKADYGYFYCSGIENSTIGNRSDIYFNNNGPMNYEGVTHYAGSNEITVNTAGDYLVDYNINLADGTGANNVGITVNGLVNDSTKKLVYIDSGEVSGKAILHLEAGDILTLRNDSDNSITLDSQVGTQLNIVRVSSVNKNYGYFYSNDISVAPGNQVSLNNDDWVDGIAHVPGDNTITIVNDGIYLVEYSANVSTCMGLGNFQINANGTAAPSTKKVATGNGDLSGTAILSLNAGDSISLKNSYDSNLGLKSIGFTIVNLAPAPTAPTVQAKDITFSDVTTTGMTINWTNGDGTGRAVFVKEGTDEITNPTDGTTYYESSDWSNKGDQLGSSGYYCVYNGSGDSVTLSNLNEGKEYTVQIFEYNGSVCNELYLTNTATNNPTTQSTLKVIPTVSSVSIPTDGTYKYGESLNFTVCFDEAVIVDTAGGTPSIPITIGESTRNATYKSGNGTNQLTFSYIVANSDVDTDGIAVGSSVELNGGTIKDADSNDANLTLNSIPSTENVKVDTLAPTVSSVSAPADGTYKSGELLDFTVNFDEAVTVDTTGGSPSIPITIGENTCNAVYKGGSNTNQLTFSYTVANGDVDTDGIATVSNIELNGCTIKDEADNDANLTLNNIANTENVKVDAVVPTVSAVNVPPDGTYKSGDSIIFLVKFNKDITLNGTPSIPITIGENSCNATYYSSNTDSITFSYTIADGETDKDGIAVGTSIALNGGTIKDEADNNADLTLNNIGDTTNVKVDALAPTVSSIVRQVPSSEVTNADSISYRVSFDEAVSGVDVSDFTLTKSDTADGNISDISLVTDSDNTKYDITVDSISGSGTLRLDLNNTGTEIKDLAGNAIDGGFTSGGTYTIDKLSPTVTDANISLNSDTYKIGDTVEVTWDDTAIGDNNGDIDTVTVDFSAFGGGSAVDATNSSDTWTASYTIVKGSIDSTDLNVSVTATDTAGNSTTTDDTSNARLDNIAPTIVSGKLASGYKYVDVTFSEGVYGGTGTSALDGNDFLLIFEQNSGNATDATISAIKNESGAELEGGETKVRIYLDVTGTTSGAETIEIKPANGSSILDELGNTVDANQTTGALNAIPSSGGGTPADDSADIIVNGKTESAGKATSSVVDGKKKQTVLVDSEKIEKILEDKGNGASVIIPVTGEGEIASGVLTGQIVKNLEKKEATLEVMTGTASYTLPASEINIDRISEQIGKDVALSNIEVEISISAPSDEMAKVVENAAENGGLELMVPAVDFSISCTHGDKTVNATKFNSYIERTVAIPDGVDYSKITTAIVVDADGNTRHIPTKVTVIDGKYYAVINSLTNSTYSVVWHPVEFADAENHWAKDAINDMGSRMVVLGVSEKTYEPERDITRAEFAAIVVRALGLEPEPGDSGFSDVLAKDWFNEYVKTAESYGIINGYGNGHFGPNDKITREQAMTIVARAMKITDLDVDITANEVGAILSKYMDGTKLSDYARESVSACIKTEIVFGRSANELAPRDNISRAEVAVIVKRLLTKSELI